MAFSGIMTALITPFSDGKLDKKSFLRLLHFQVDSGVRTFILASTTGESPVLEDQEVETLCKWFKNFEEESKLSLKTLIGAWLCLHKKNHR